MEILSYLYRHLLTVLRKIELINYSDTEKAVKRFPNCTFISFESGGHLMEGHGEEIKKAVSKFIKEGELMPL